MYRVVFVFLFIWVQIAGQCRFPSEWQGRWFQSGLGEVVIHDHTIDKKGHCRENHRDLYLVHNTRSNCVQCLLIMQRHRNIIQYKESYCLDGASLDFICAQIRAEFILYTLVREPSLPVACPFQDAYHFSYNNNTGGFCRDPSSYVQTCAGDSKFRFDFQHCPEAAYTYEKRMEFECLATWKDGSDSYIYGGFAGGGLTKKDDVYRCFMYSTFGTVVYLAMSADATCRGLLTPRDGPLVMEFTKDIFGWPQPACRFPDWFIKTTWQDLSGQHLYIPDEVGEKITSWYRRQHHAVPHVRYAFRCMRVELEDTTHNQFVGVSYTSHDCDTKFQCIKILKKHPHIIEVHRGAHVRDENAVCHDIHFQNAKIQLLIPRSIDNSPCPFSGRFYTVPEPKDCVVDIRSGCNKTSDLEITTSCMGEPEGRLECLETWWEGDQQLLLARRMGDTSHIVNCFGIKSEGETMRFFTSHQCQGNVLDVLDKPLSFIINSIPASCNEPRIQTKLLPSDNNEKPLSHPEHVYGTGYKHMGSSSEEEPGGEKRDTATYTNKAVSLTLSSWGALSIAYLYIVLVQR